MRNDFKDTIYIKISRIIFLCVFQLIGLEECFSRIQAMVEDCKKKAGLESSTALKGLVCYEGSKLGGAGNPGLPPILLGLPLISAGSQKMY